MKVFDTGLNSAVSGLSYSYSGTTINLDKKYLDDKNLTLFCNIKTDTSTTSSQLFVTAQVANNSESGVSWANFVSGSGTSVLIATGTQTGGEAGNGTYIVPLTIVPHSGVTQKLKGIPAIKFGAKTNRATQAVSMHLMVG